MAKWVNSLVLDDGINVIKNNAVRMHLVSAYTLGDSYATIVTNTLAIVTMTGTDFTVAAAGSNRTLTTASGKSATASASAGGTPDLHIAFTNNSNAVYWVTDETSNQPITSGNTVNFPQLVYTSNQPT
jgi:hypothetical protein